MHTDDSLHAHFEAATRRLLDGNEKLIPLGKACQFLNATRGQRVHTSSLSRWILRGKMGVRLDAIRMNGGGWWTSREALSRFAAQLSARAAGQAVADAAIPTESEMERRDKRAKQRLRELGVKC